MNHFFQSVIMVDDDDATNFLHKRIIKKLNPNADIKIFNESLQAISYLDKPDTHSPDLMFLDINMPAVPGWELIENLCSRHRDSLSIIVLSTHICMERREKFSSSDYRITFIEKPLSLNKLDKALI